MLWNIENLKSFKDEDDVRTAFLATSSRGSLVETRLLTVLFTAA